MNMARPPGARPRLAVIAGPTGVGKSELALQAAAELDGEIINADSLAFYRGFNVGTAKPSPADRARVVHHLLDILDPDENFDAAAYLARARPLIRRLAAAGRPPLAVGGSGFYLRSLTQGLFEGPGRDEAFRAGLAAETAAALHLRLAAVDPETAARLAPADRPRLERALEVHRLTGRPISQWQREHGFREKPFQALIIILDRPPAEMEARLRRRVESMFKRGLKEEIENLLQAGWSPQLKPFGAIGYRETLAHMEGRLSLDEAAELTFLATRRYAKRQRTWFRGQTPEALWFHPDRADEIMARLRCFFSRQEEI